MVHFKSIAIGAIAALVIGGMVVVSTGENPRDVDDANKGRTLISTQNPIRYIRDSRTDLCFSRTGIYAQDTTLSEVPCTEKVLKAIEEDKSR